MCLSQTNMKPKKGQSWKAIAHQRKESQGSYSSFVSIRRLKHIAARSSFSFVIFDTMFTLVVLTTCVFFLVPVCIGKQFSRIQRIVLMGNPEAQQEAKIKWGSTIQKWVGRLYTHPYPLRHWDGTLFLFLTAELKIPRQLNHVCFFFIIKGPWRCDPSTRKSACAGRGVRVRVCCVCCVFRHHLSTCRNTFGVAFANQSTCHCRCRLSFCQWCFLDTWFLRYGERRRQPSKLSKGYMEEPDYDQGKEGRYLPLVLTKRMNQ